jgi:hypothetical protein
MTADDEVREAARLRAFLDGHDLTPRRMLRGDEADAVAPLCYTDAATRSLHHDQRQKPLTSQGSAVSVCPSGGGTRARDDA